jgi:MOSC domain-containing protein YiiM
VSDSGARIAQLSVSNGGVPKKAVESVRVTALGLEGDAHRDQEHHGGPERAVCLFAMEAIRALQAEGHPLVPGALGENVTLEGLDWSAIQPGRACGSARRSC